ncbi:hypothetical protein ACWC2K_00405 [Streptomyces chattanoogensis]
MPSRQFDSRVPLQPPEQQAYRTPHTTGIAVLVGATLLSVAASGTAVAAPRHGTGNKGVEANTSIPDGFFKPGAHTIVKRNTAKQLPATSSARLKADDDVEISEPKELCGTTKLEKTSGQGKTTLVMTVEKSVKVGMDGEFGISAEELSAKLGFSVEASVTVQDQTRYEVPNGKMGTVDV